MRKRKNKRPGQRNQNKTEIIQKNVPSVPIYIHYLGAVIVAIVLTIVFHFADVQFFHPRFKTSQKAIVNEEKLIDKYKAHELSSTESLSIGEIYFNAATRISDKMPEKGQLGMLYLLAAYDHAPLMEGIIFNVVRNYLNLNFTNFALEELDYVLSLDPDNDEAQASKRMIKKEQPLRWKAYYKVKKTLNKNRKSDTFPMPHFSLMFATLVGHYDLRHQLTEEMNLEFYEATKYVYEKIFVPDVQEKSETHLSDTQLNHVFHFWQMQILKGTGNYHPEFTKCKLFSRLMTLTREACRIFFLSLGYSPERAALRAAHDLIFWISVHTKNSVHEPHKTDDALLGGVYYVSVPPNSGNLVLFDPRGMSPMLESADPDSPFGKKKMPTPPFHRTVAVKPYSGLLTVFPGWLMHQVLPSPGLSNDKYRVSISLNLKGEWQDTTHMMLDHVKIPTLTSQQK